jgi:hypothetical protein
MSNITYNWERISVIDSQSTDTALGLRHIIKKLWFVREGSDSKNKADIRQVLALSAPDPSNYTPISNLTKQQLVSWIEFELGTIKLKEIDDLIAQRLLDMQNRKQLTIEELQQINTSTPIIPEPEPTPEPTPEPIPEPIPESTPIEEV